MDSTDGSASPTHSTQSISTDETQDSIQDLSQDSEVFDNYWPSTSFERKWNHGVVIEVMVDTEFDARFGPFSYESIQAIEKMKQLSAQHRDDVLCMQPPLPKRARMCM